LVRTGLLPKKKPFWPFIPYRQGGHPLFRAEHSAFSRNAALDFRPGKLLTCLIQPSAQRGKTDFTIVFPPRFR
jgi:hypothetical protein